MTFPDGTIQCLLCRGIVTFKEKDPIKFNLHLKNEHAVYFAVDILLAICLMDSEEQETVKNVVFNWTRVDSLTLFQILSTLSEK